ncbi:hypothetical protein KOI35_11920 [Actinoplanes bogorensis]|uniref:Uncharacterized protein n=1 Tax=Paractinoplanes bogorensis TaxID=1610840 RepID=A0ABS5YL51_9ACTN|nr:hypothetical protein [Actinoplanes bogorensis]MBU2664199.1 hypothetical protein [Actinoplanes bogorensis]
MIEAGGRVGPIPEEWRATLTAIVDSLARRDDVLASGVDSVEPVSLAITAACLDAVDACGGATLVLLPGEAWTTSVAGRPLDR